MKLIVSIIRPSAVDAVRGALSSLGVVGMTLTDVRGYGRQKGQTEFYRGAEYATNFVPKIKLEIVVRADLADRVVDAIRASAHSGKIGDGKIFVIDVDNAMRIRTGEQKHDAL